MILLLVKLCQWPQLCGLSIFLNITSQKKCDLLIQTEELLPLEKKKKQVPVESHLIKSPLWFNHFTAGWNGFSASFPSCKDALSSLISRCVKSRKSKSSWWTSFLVFFIALETKLRENKKETIHSGRKGLIYITILALNHQSLYLFHWVCLISEAYNFIWTIKYCFLCLWSSIFYLLWSFCQCWMTACDKIEAYLTRNRLKKREIDELLLRFGYSPFHVTLTRPVKSTPLLLQ